MLSKSWVQLLYHLPEPARRLSAHIGFLYPVTRSSILEWKNKQTKIIIKKNLYHYLINLYGKSSLRVIWEYLMFPELKIGISLRINS